MPDSCGDNRLIDYSPEYQDDKSEFASFGSGTPVMTHGRKIIVEHGIFDDGFPEGKIVQTINFDPPINSK